ncbi:Hydrolase-like protein [Zostera marina]|uniref:Hydrolase-like protein n=1 Tax=Zostera marina TaxID=29655 RepID=A0A0K9PHA7_ZOSMR|nr:Hydrolase-like protein [Zostera marina]
MESCLSIVSIYGSYLHRIFTSAGLRRKFISIDSGETSLYYWTPTNTTTRPTVVLIHGFGPEPKWQWMHQIKPLSSRFHLVVPELIFFGNSTTHSSKRTEIFQAECLIKLLDGIGVDKFYPIGTSYGGFVAYHVARICGKERVQKVVIASSNLLKREGDNDKLLKSAGVNKIEELLLPQTAAMIKIVLKLVIYRCPWLPDFFLRDLIRTLYTDNREEKVELINAVTLEKSDGLHQLSQKVLILWGDHDGIFPIEKAGEIKKQIGEKEDDVVLEVIKNTSHIPHAENPARFNTIVTNFLLTTISI